MDTGFSVLFGLGIACWYFESWRRQLGSFCSLSVQGLVGQLLNVLPEMAGSHIGLMMVADKLRRMNYHFRSKGFGQMPSRSRASLLDHQVMNLQADQLHDLSQYKMI